MTFLAGFLDLMSWLSGKFWFLHLSFLKTETFRLPDFFPWNSIAGRSLFILKVRNRYWIRRIWGQKLCLLIVKGVFSAGFEVICRLRQAVLAGFGVICRLRQAVLAGFEVICRLRQAAFGRALCFFGVFSEFLDFLGFLAGFLVKLEPFNWFCCRFFGCCLADFPGKPPPEVTFTRFFGGDNHLMFFAGFCLFEFSRRGQSFWVPKMWVGVHKLVLCVFCMALTERNVRFFVISMARRSVFMVYFFGRIRGFCPFLFGVFLDKICTFRTSFSCLIKYRGF